MRRSSSLAFRLIAVAAVWTAVAVVAAGLVLAALYQRTVQRSFDEQLFLYSTVIAGQAVAAPPGTFAGPQNLGEVRFEGVLTGWYWQVTQGGERWFSQSLVFSPPIVVPLEDTVPNDNGTRTFSGEGPAGEQVRGLIWPVTVEETGITYEIIVAGNTTEMEAQIGAFRVNVLLTLSVFGLVLILATFLQVRVGLRPLDRVRRGLADLRSGRETRIEGPFPSEIDPLAKELNALLDSNQQIIERARTQVGNLAHALKTPLSVITNEARAAKGPLADKITEQAALMGRQITHYLDRARIAARSRVIGAVTPVEPVIARLARAMTRIYEEKGIRVTADVPAGVAFRGEQQDLEEIVGNLADNACKWAKGTVAISVVAGAVAGEGRISVRIDDDGPGVPADKRDEATRRGRRLDESKPGSGLGLSIVSDLVGLYQGSFTLGDAPLGGLRAEVVLPAA